MFYTLTTAYTLFALGLISPGPDFAMTVQNSISYGRKAGFSTAFGIASANLIHLALLLFGVGTLLESNPRLFFIVKATSVFYFLYLAWRAFRPGKSIESTDQILEHQSNLDRKFSEAFRDGFLVNLFNFKAFIFWISLISFLSEFHMPLIALLGFFSFAVFSVLVWFSFVASVLTVERLRSVFVSNQRAIEKSVGVILAYLAFKLALSLVVEAPKLF